jgi:glutamate-1-semialdehyde 2,1-aminomutase
MILGHSHPEVLSAVNEAMAKGQLYAGQFADEVHLAELICQSVPSAELIRLGLSGSESDQAAIRLARGYTARDLIIKFEGHYHGWLDHVVYSVGPSPEQAGPVDSPNRVPISTGLLDRDSECVIVLPWNDIDAVTSAIERNKGRIAAIITEPMMCNNGCIPPKDGFLQGLRRICDDNEIILIFDEVITGFRLSLGGAQEHFGVTPDLSVFGKAFANGFPVSVLAGREKFMRLVAEGKVLHAGTLNSQTPCVAAALATLRILSSNNGEIYGRLNASGERLRVGLAEAATKAGHRLLIQGIGPVFHTGFSDLSAVETYRDTWSYDTAKYTRFADELLARGIRVIGRGIWYISAAHTDDDIDHTVSIAEEAFKAIGR